MKNKLAYFLFFCIMLISGAAFATERITSFNSLVQAQYDGSLIVTEKIAVYHEGKEIRRGIYRDLPTSKGEKYKLLEILRDGNPEPGFVENISGFYRINTGNDNYLPQPALSEFTIKYKVWNIPQAYDGYDEIYWNVTGDGWRFPIEKVSAKIELPPEASIIQQASYIGRYGSNEPATNTGVGSFKGRLLLPGEQMTVAVGFTPGVISTKKLANYKNIFLPAGYIIYLIFLLWTWNKKGKDPASKAIMPQYEPPKELSAAQAYCLYNKGAVNDIFPISVIQMIINGFLKLSTKEEGSFIFKDTIYLVERTGKEPSDAEEKLYKEWGVLKFDGEYNSVIGRLAGKYQNAIKDSVKHLYAKNTMWVFVPTVLYIFSLFFAYNTLTDFFNIIAPALFITFALAWVGSLQFSTLFRQGAYASLFILGGWYLLFMFIISPNYGSDIVPFILLNLTLGTSAIFSYLIYKPSEKGLRLIEHLEGLKMFLKATKEPEVIKKSLDDKCMEKLFPYAMAIGLEKEWKEKFTSLFGKEAYQEFMLYHPYTSNTFASGVSTSARPPSKGGGSGSFGGGCSGGGFGGGGGGGR